MDTNLVGYLLGNLDADTHRQVEARLRRDPRARAALARVRRQLGPLAALRSPSQPSPPGLARRTVARLAAHRRLPEAPPLSPGQRTESRGFGIRRADLVVAALAVMVVLACVGPWLAACQRQARIRAGQENLAQVWMTLRSQTDMQTTPAGYEVDGSHSLDEMSESALTLSCTPPASDRWPLLRDGRDREEEVPPPYGVQNVLYVGGHVNRVDPIAIQRLSFYPMTLVPATEEAPR